MEAVAAGFAAAAVREGSTWLKLVLDEHRDKKLAGAANLVYEAGIVLVELRGLNTRMQELFSPLAMFNPEEWDDQRRKDVVQQLQAFAQSGPAFGILNVHTFALRELDAPEEVEALRDRLVELAVNVAHLGEPEPGDDAAPAGWQSDVAEYGARGREAWGDATFQSGPGSPDFLIQNSLPALLWLVRHGQAAEEVTRLRTLAQGLLVTRSKRADKKLADVVQEAEKTFGKLTGILRRTYRRIPPPTWTASGP